MTSSRQQQGFCLWLDYHHQALLSSGQWWRDCKILNFLRTISTWICTEAIFSCFQLDVDAASFSHGLILEWLILLGEKELHLISPANKLDNKEVFLMMCLFDGLPPNASEMYLTDNWGEIPITYLEELYLFVVGVNEDLICFLFFKFKTANKNSNLFLKLFSKAHRHRQGCLPKTTSFLCKIFFLEILLQTLKLFLMIIISCRMGRQPKTYSQRRQEVVNSFFIHSLDLDWLTCAINPYESSRRGKSGRIWRGRWEGWLNGHSGIPMTSLERQSTSPTQHSLSISHATNTNLFV